GTEAGAACADGEVCVDGACATSCPGPQIECGGSCVDPDTDRAYCGASGDCTGAEAGAACADGEVCVDGACATSCPAGQLVCDEACVDPLVDRQFCGATGDCTGAEAGAACAEGEICDGTGVCRASCSTGLVACGGACIDPESNPSYCGASGDCSGAGAGAVCTATQACVAGSCVELDPCPVPTGDEADLVVGAASAVAVEGGDAVTYTLALAAEPCTPVTVTLTADPQLTIAPSSLVFEPTDWSTAQIVDVRAVHDFDREGDHAGRVAHALASRDTGYHRLPVADAVIPIEDRAHLTHISVAADGAGSDGATTLAAVDGTGAHVAFASAATDLVANDTAGFVDVFLRDVAAGTTLRLSQTASEEGNGNTRAVGVSNDGTRVVFNTAATNLVDPAGTAAGDVYLYTAGTGLTLASGRCATCNQELASGGVAISGNGAFVAYATRRQLLPADPETEYDIYVLEVATGTATLDSLNSIDGNGTFYWGSNAFGPTLSSTGRYLGFNSPARNLDTPDLTVQNFHSYVKDRTSRVLTRVSRHSGGTATCEGAFQNANSGSPTISADGSLAAFESRCAITVLATETPDTNGVYDVFVRDIAAQTTSRVSVSTEGAQADAQSLIVTMSDDGRYVLFASDASNLVADDTNGVRDLFLRDRTANTTIRVGVDVRYDELPAGTLHAAMSRDGRFVAFTTLANLLASDDNTDIEDLYLIQLR
ncbi:MAG: PD40 domain-containing protein, partial [Deltaproteobacteria bacterium]|nr:PD40 domain-containing protein [Deltaproteobacteria bacterium]